MRQILQNDLFRRVASLFGGTAGGYLLIVLLSPILTRIFSPAEMGHFGVFNAAVAILSVVLALGFDYAVIGSRTITQSIRAMSAGLTALLGMTLLVVLLSIFAVISGMLSGVEFTVLAALAFALPVAAISVAFTLASNCAIRAGNTKIASRGLFINLSGRVVLQIPLGLIWGSEWALIAGDGIGRSAAIFATGPKTLLIAGRHVSKRFQSTIQWIGKQYRFPVFLMPANLLEVLYLWAPPPLFAIYYGVEAAGLLTLILRFATAPSAVANLSFAQIFHFYAGQKAKNEVQLIKKRLWQLALLMTAMFVPPWIVLFLFHEDIFVTVFGPSWSSGGLAATVFAPLVLSQVLNVFAGRVMIVLDKQFLRALFFAICLLVSVASVAAGGALGMDFVSTLTVMSAALFSFQMLYFVGFLFSLKGNRGLAE